MPNMVDETLVPFDRVTKIGEIVLWDLKLINEKVIWFIARVSRIHSLYPWVQAKEKWVPVDGESNEETRLVEAGCDWEGDELDEAT